MQIKLDVIVWVNELGCENAISLLYVFILFLFHILNLILKNNNFLLSYKNNLRVLRRGKVEVGAAHNVIKSIVSITVKKITYIIHKPKLLPHDHVNWKYITLLFSSEYPFINFNILTKLKPDL